MKKILIIGGGIAGMEAAHELAALGYSVVIVERKDTLGGHVRKWDRLFPNKRSSEEVIAHLLQGVKHPLIEIRLKRTVVDLRRNPNGTFLAILSDETPITADAVLFCTGYHLFDAYKKEEYGYGIYNNVITSAELEKMFKNGKVLTAEGKTPERIGIVHCVGSRDAKCGNLYCSRICCVTGVKQAIELKELIPGVEVFNFYMDLRMFGRGFEQLYLEAQQQHRVRFVRGRLSEASETQDRRIYLKVDDTLVGRPMKMTVDLLVLMVGFEPRKTTLPLLERLGIERNEDGFIKVRDCHFDENRTNVNGIYVAGACTSAKSINETLTDACSAALEIHRNLSSKKS
ncbi:MAG: CoB--CoM heterodisulfide reductase iron-sulfur subunit A family protein [Paludibacteraceae bacterium]|nr:CoB--CoM heterodisulfide reductase iron-sulfur subunit A family protein [Paludibacteraceae bacterium]